MSSALDIRTEIASRVGSLGTVYRGKRKFNQDELPALCVYMSERSNEAHSDTKVKVAAQVVVEYHDTALDAVDDQADAMQLEIRNAVETAERTLSNSVIYPGIVWESDDIFYPEEGGNTVAVQVAYSCPHVITYNP